MNEKPIGTNSPAEVGNSKAFNIGTYSILFCVSAGMTVLNYYTNKGYLTLCTGIFAVLCIINVVLTLFGKKGSSIARKIFAFEVLCMFTFFLVSGNPDGFSAIWICMLPMVSMLFFNRHMGSYLCVTMFAVLIFFLWIPYGNTLLMYDYNQTFKMRFPVLYIAFCVVSYYMELKQENAYLEMNRLQYYYRDLSMKDALTSLYNRQGMYAVVKNNVGYTNGKEVCVVMFDIDDFKGVNDRYGHDMGDFVLQKFSDIIRERLNAVNCRWGGEEFVSVFKMKYFTVERLEQVRKEFESYVFYDEGDSFQVTVSIGVHSERIGSLKQIDALISKADEALYIAKASGKNRMVFYKNI